MPNSEQSVKRVIVHVGPHKTGSTAIQQCLTANQSALDKLDIYYFHNDKTHNAAMLLAKEAFEEAEIILQEVSRQISDVTATTIILSQEDFCGDLPGRSRRKAIYPKFMKNLRIVARALKPHSVSFAFFLRDGDDWLKSCYHQHLKHRTLFSDFDMFRGHFKESPSIDATLKKPKETFGNAFTVLPYSRVPDAGVRALLNIAGCSAPQLPHTPEFSNASPDSGKIRLLERINALSSFKSTAWLAKALVLRDWAPRFPIEQPSGGLGISDGLAGIALPDLTRRALHRIGPQNIEDILPLGEVNLEDYVFDILPTGIELDPNWSRVDIHDQSRILDYHLRGKSKLAKLNALTISYLRRDTNHTKKAKHLFHRIWTEYGTLLVNELSTRWLISTLQTFLDHGLNDAQRMIGAGGYFYANMVKIYEGERSIEGLEQDAIHHNVSPQTPSKFSGLDRYNIGGTDLHLNTNAMALDLAMRDDVAGLVLQELLLRVSSSANVFTRMDQTRHTKCIKVEGFQDTWSFFTEPH